MKAGSSQLWLSTDHSSFALKSSSVNQTGAVRLFLRLLVSTRRRPAEEWLNHADGPWLMLGSEVRIPWGRWVEILGSHDGDTARLVAKHGDRYPDAVRTALSKLLTTNLGLPGVFERDATRGYDVLNLAEIEPDVDLVTRAEELADALSMTSSERLKRLRSLEVRVQGTFEDPESLTVHPHLTPFAEPIVEMYLDVLRGIVDAAADFPDTGARELVTEIGPKLEWYGERGFSAGATAVRFLSTAEVRYGALDERWDLLTRVFGDESLVPEAAQDYYGGNFRKVAAQPRPTPFDPADLLTGTIVSMRDADPLALGVHPVDRRHVPAGANVPPYVRRSCEMELVDRLSAALHRPGMSVLVLTGESTAGKTRLAFEVLHRKCRHAFVIAPRIGPNLLRAIDPANHPEIPDARSLVLLWLDDLEQFVNDDVRLTAGHLREIGGRWPGRLIVLCTYGGRARDEITVGRVDLAELQRILSLAWGGSEVEVPTLLDSDEFSRVSGLEDTELIEDVGRYGLGPALTASRVLAQRYRGLLHFRDEQVGQVDWQEGQAVVDALLGWRAVTGGAPMPESLARQAWELTRRTRARRSRPDGARWDAAVDWATTVVVPGRAPAYMDWSRAEMTVDRAVAPNRSAQHAQMARRVFGDLIPGPNHDAGSAHA